MKSPFKFLDAFTLQDKDAFFGRDQEIDDLYALAFKTSLILVYGLSGTGKTSLVQCGLASRFDGPDWYPIFVRRNENINTSLTNVLENALGQKTGENVVENISRLLRKTLRPVYLLFDQMEELFILGQEAEQRTFMTSLRELLDSQLPAKIILIMREEYIGQLYQYEQMIPELFDHRFRVEPMGPAKVKNVIRSSFEKFNIHLADPKEELLELMVQNISDPRTGITLPYLQVYLDMLYQDQYHKQYGQTEPGENPALDITKKEIDAIGRIDNILERYLEDQIRELRESLSKKYKNIPANAVQQVLDVFVSEEGTKRPVHYKQVESNLIITEEAASGMQGVPDILLTDILKYLEQDRILRRGDDYMELAHDSLALIIDNRRSESQRQLQNIRKRLLNAYEEFQKTGAFLNQKQLAAFDEYRSQLGLSPELEAFLVKCEDEVERQAAEDKERLQQENKMAEQKKLARTRTIWLFIALILAGLAVFMAMKFYSEKETVNKHADNLKVYGDSMDLELFKKTNLLDSLSNAIRQANTGVSDLDKLVNSSTPLKRTPISRIMMSIKKAISPDSMSETEKREWLAHHVAAKSIMLTSSIDKNHLEAVVPDSNFDHETIYAVLQLTSPLPKEEIELRWLKNNVEIPGKTTYMDILSSNANHDGLQRLYSMTTLIDTGTYRLEVSNSAGILIGHQDFSRVETIDEESNSPNTTFVLSQMKINAFITMSSGNMNSPGPATNSFKVGQMINYWVSLYIPTEGESVSVQLLDDKYNIVWEDHYKTSINTSDSGYRIWRFHGARSPGTYQIKVVADKGYDLGAASSHDIIIE